LWPGWHRSGGLPERHRLRHRLLSGHRALAPSSDSGGEDRNAVRIRIQGKFGAMRYLHTMLRVRDLAAALDFFGKLGLREARRQESQAGRFTLVFLSTGAPEDPAEVELTYNWDQAEPYPTGRFFGHLAYEVDDIYQFCERISAAGIPVLRPPRDGRMAFIKSPDGHSVELLQRGEALARREPWASMPNHGEW
jgi:lactoylglutathione lyase